MKTDNVSHNVILKTIPMEIPTLTCVNHVTLLVDVVPMLPNVLVVMMDISYTNLIVIPNVQMDTMVLMVFVNLVTILVKLVLEALMMYVSLVITPDSGFKDIVSLPVL